MYTLSNKDRERILRLMDLTRDLHPATLKEQNQLRLARQALKRLARKDELDSLN